jgi:hypothetical protein
MTLLKDLSAPSFVSSASALRAASMNRLDCSGSSFFEVLDGMGAAISQPRPNRYRLYRLDTNSLIGEPLAFAAADRNGRALTVVDAKLDASVVPEIELSQVPLEMLAVDVLIGADQPTLEDRKEAFEGVGMHVIPRPLELGMIDAFVPLKHQLVMLALVGHEAAIFVNMTADHVADPSMVNHERAHITAALHKAQDNRVGPLAAGATFGLARIGDGGFVSFDGLASAAHRSGRAGVHCEPDAMPKMPSGFHAAAKHPLKLAGGDAFLTGAQQMDCLQPQPERQMAVLENGADPHGKGAATGVALAQPRPGGFAAQATDLGLIDVPAMRADGAIRPKLAFDVLESSVLVVETIVGKNRVSHDLPRFVEASLHLGVGYVK